MKYQLFTIFDEKAEAIAGPILIFPREGPALRYFHDQMADNPQYNKHPTDYTLIEIGSIDEQTGLVEPRKHTDTEGNSRYLMPETIARGENKNA